MKKAILIAAAVFILAVIVFKAVLLGSRGAVSLHFRGYTNMTSSAKSAAVCLSNGMNQPIFYIAEGQLSRGTASKRPAYYTLEKIPDREEYPTVLLSPFNHYEEIPPARVIDFEVPFPTNGNKLISIHLDCSVKSRKPTTLWKIQTALARFFPVLAPSEPTSLAVKLPPED